MILSLVHTRLCMDHWYLHASNQKNNQVNGFSELQEVLSPDLFIVFSSSSSLVYNHIWPGGRGGRLCLLGVRRIFQPSPQGAVTVRLHWTAGNHKCQHFIWSQSVEGGSIMHAHMNKPSTWTSWLMECVEPDRKICRHDLNDSKWMQERSVPTMNQTISRSYGLDFQGCECWVGKGLQLVKTQCCPSLSSTDTNAASFFFLRVTPQVSNTARWRQHSKW